MVEPYGFIILLVLLYFGILGAVLWPFVDIFIDVLPIPLNTAQVLSLIF